MHTFQVKYSNAKTVYFRFFDPAQGAGANLYTFDFDDNAWETSLAGATTPKLAATEKTDAGDADESLYVATTDMASMNNTATPLEVLVQAVDDLATDQVISEQACWVVSGEVVDLVDVEQISGDTTAADNLESDYDGTGYAGGTIPKQADVTKIGGVAQSATDLKDFADTGYDPSTHLTQADVAAGRGSTLILTGTVDTVTNSHTPTTTEFQADDITEATADHYNGRLVLFVSGALVGQAAVIEDYENVGGIGQFTVRAMTEAPANNDTFVIL